MKLLSELDVSLDQSTQASSLQRSKVVVGGNGIGRIDAWHGGGYVLPNVEAEPQAPACRWLSDRTPI